MPPVSQVEHRGTSNLALPYISNASVIDTTTHFISGTQNILTGLRGWSERRPGFSQAVESVASTFTNLQRSFTWQRWANSTPNGGAFIWMGCDVSGGVAKVYKYIFGVDTSAVLLWTSTSATPFDFVVSNNTCYFGNGTDMKKWDSNTLSNWGIATPTVAPTLTVNSGTGLTVYTSWCYCYTYYNSNTAHESSPSAISACSGGPITFASIGVRVTASLDPQVTNIRIYRTPDGGAQDPALMQEISISPVANTTGTYVDTTLDVNLSIRVAPEFLTNDPPTPQRGFVAYSGRLWGFLNNTSYYSGFEEIQNGVPEECWPSGLGGNYYPWDKQVEAHATLSDGVTVFTSQRIYKIDGDSLDTFRRYTLLERRGTRSITSVVSLGGSVAWLDTSSTVWISDVGEVGIPIRPDIQNINPLTAYISIHISGIYHWLVLLDGAAGVVYIYDLDRQVWLPPWTIGSSASALFSGETSVGEVQLMMARNNTKVLQLVSGTYTDDTSNTFVPIIKTNMYRLTPDNNPAFQGVHDFTEIKTDANLPSKVQILTDDDPASGVYVDLTPNEEPSPLIVQGKSLLTTRFPDNEQQAQFMSLMFTWPAAKVNFHLYQMDEAFHGSGG